PPHVRRRAAPRAGAPQLPYGHHRGRTLPLDRWRRDVGGRVAGGRGRAAPWRTAPRGRPRWLAVGLDRPELLPRPVCLPLDRRGAHVGRASGGPLFRDGVHGGPRWLAVGRVRA